MDGGPRWCAAQPAPSPPPPAARGARTRRAPTAQPPPSPPVKVPDPNAQMHPQRRHSTRWHNPQGTLQGATCGCPPLQALGTVQCSAPASLLVPLHSGSLFCRRGQGHPWGDSPSPARGRGRDPGEGAHPWLGVPRHPRAREPALATPATSPAAEAVGRCGTWLPQLPLLTVTWSEPQPGDYFWLCITSQRTLPPRCRSPATHPRARPSLHARAAAGPTPTAPRPAGAAHRFASRRLAVMPGARSAGG